MLTRRPRKSKPYAPKEIMTVTWGVSASCVRLPDGRYEVTFHIGATPHTAVGMTARDAWHRACLRYQDTQNGNGGRAS
jgi:hypothetical protein